MASVAAPIAGGIIGSLLKPSTGLAALPPQQNFQPQIQQANQNINTNIGNQNAFAQALQTQTQGGGPNLAGSLLSNATGQNVANQAALMASQRGTGSNAGLIARQAAQQGAGIQENATGQAAALRQQQQLNAQQNLGNIYGQIGQESGQQLGSYLQGNAQQNQQILGTNQINAGIGQGNTQGAGSVMSGIGQALPGIASALSPAKTAGAPSTNVFANPSNPSSGGPDANAVAQYLGRAEGGLIEQDKTQLPDHLQMISDIYHPNESAHNGYNAATNQYAKGGKVSALVSPGEIELKPQEAKKVAEGKADPMKIGTHIPGKPKVPGAVNSYDNDNVPKKLSVGSVIVPRSETKSEYPSRNSTEFVKAVVDKQINKKGKKS